MNTQYLLCSGLKDEDGEFIHVPSELTADFPNPAIYTVNDTDYVVLGVRPSNPDNYNVSDLELLEQSITTEEFEARVTGYLSLGHTNLLVYLSNAQVHKLYDRFKPIEEET